MLRTESELKEYKDSEDYSDWVQSQRHAALEHQYKARKWTCNRYKVKAMREATISYLLSVGVLEVSAVTDAMALGNDPYLLANNPVLRNTYLGWFMLPEERQSRTFIQRHRNNVKRKVTRATKLSETKPIKEDNTSTPPVFLFEDDERASLSLPEILALKAKGIHT